MIWRWLICSSVALGLVFAASVTGEIELTNSKNVAVRKHKDYAGVVLWLEPVDRPVPPLTPRKVEMQQRDKQFLPHVLAISLGSTVELPNLDLIFHNAFSNFSGQPFDVGLYAPRTSRSVTFKHAGIVRVFCNIHATMSAIIAVVNTPWYAVTMSNGKYTFNNVPPGEYNLHMFHERALPGNLTYLERRIAIPDTGLVMPLISITETGFIPAEHLNKYGKDYPPAANDSAYPGAPKK